MKKILLLSALAMVLTITSCKKDLCNGITCSNYGTCKDGVCSCDIGHTGTNCQVNMAACAVTHTATLNITNNAGEDYNLYKNSVYVATISSGTSSITVATGSYNFQVKEVNYILSQTTHSFSFTFTDCVPQYYSFP